jgi:hypothetical protein
MSRSQCNANSLFGEWSALNSGQIQRRGKGIVAAIIILAGVRG